MIQRVVQLFTLISSLAVIKCKYQIIQDLTQANLQSEWIDQNTLLPLPIQSSSTNEAYIGQDPKDVPIFWKRLYNMKLTTRVYVYIEFSLSGKWSESDLIIYANNLKVYAEQFTLSNQVIDNSEIKSYNSYIQFVVKQHFDILALEVHATPHYLGLYFKNIILMQQTQSGRDEQLQYSFELIPGCVQGNNYNQYYCVCQQAVISTGYQCAPQCQTNQLLDSSTNQCYTVEHCSDCQGEVQGFVCDDGYYAQQNLNTLRYKCVSQCGNSEIASEQTGQCIDMQQYLIQYENQGYPVDHFYFYKNIPDFLHFMDYQDISVNVVGIPMKQQERNFIYLNNNFYIGNFMTFQTQTIEMTTEISSQHQLRVRAIAHFIDFFPVSIEITINGIQQICVIQKSLINLQNQSLDDYISYFDFIWKRDLSPPPSENQVYIKIKQPLQNGQYVGYFYLEDVHLFILECMSGCGQCFSAKFCPPCTNPDHKNPLDCSCLIGYSLVNDFCIDCPTYCDLCVSVNQCLSCLASTKRLNPPLCDKCPDSYFISSSYDECQSCIQGCKICSNSFFCTNCLNTYFRDEFNKCVKTCKNTQFYDTSDVNDPKCTVCNVNCLTCQNTATYCMSCSPTATLINNICYSCQDGFYLSGINCLPCISNCQNCKSNICDLCQDPYLYKQSTNECVLTCDPSYYGNFSNRTCTKCNTKCSTCQGGTENDCLTCNPGDVLNYMSNIKGFCSSSCLLGFYKVDSHCAMCWKGCKLCVDATQACLTCATEYYRFKNDNLCYEKCPNGYYNQKSSGFCAQCNQTCATCYGYSDSNCLSCSFPLSLYQNQCLDGCPDGYGSRNNICIQCTANCRNCFGPQQNECVQCSTGFYYLKNQCYLKCPRFFNGIRPQWVCQCIYQNCVTCKANEFFLKNVCYTECPYGSYGYNGLCIECSTTCKTCFGESDDNCLSCAPPLILYQNRCVPYCLGNSFPDYILNQCIDCHPTCYSCAGPAKTDCTACPGYQVLRSTGECADHCEMNEFLVMSESRCYACHISCKTCFGSTYKQCLSCDNYFYLNECVNSCPDGFRISDNKTQCQPDFSIDIPTCSYQCKTCELTERFCTTCSANRFSNPPSCDCEEGYYDDGVNALCKQCDHACSQCVFTAKHCVKCKGNRLLPKCECPQGYYDDQISVDCIKCQDNCKTCDENGCLSCQGDRIQNPDCICPNGYLESFKQYCEECDAKCEICIGTTLVCQKCSGLRVDAPVCSCPVGSYETSDRDCEECDQTCAVCYPGGCLTCHGNRVGPIGGKCECSTPFGINRLSINSLYCTDCDLGVPYFGLNKDFTGFTISFGGKVSLTIDQTLEICSQIFNANTLQKLGNNPICDIDLNVLFGNDNQIQVGNQQIQLLPSFTLDGCIKQFDGVRPNKLQIPDTYDQSSYLPQIQFNEINDQSTCDDTIIQLKKLYYNGKQNLKVLKWTLKLPQNDKNIIAINSYLDQITLNQSDIVIFPPLTFEPKLLYKFEIDVESFAKLQSTQTISFNINARSRVIFKPISEANQSFFRYDEIVIPARIQYKNCYETNPPPQKLLFEVIFKPTQKSIIKDNFTEGLVDGFIYDIELKFPPFYFNFSTPLTFQFNTALLRSDYNVNNTYEYSINLIPTLPVLSIIGGNQVVGYTEKLILNATIKDADYSDQEKLSQIQECYWTCNDIVNGTICVNQLNEVIEFSNNCYQTLPPKTFNPYSVMVFRVTIIKVDVEYTTKVAIQIVESNLPVLTVIGASQSDTHNFYDELLYNLIYPGINPDNIMYAGAVLYDSVVQATFQFFYLDFKFTISNYFSDFARSTGNIAKLRLSVYDPRFILPSLNSQVLIMNIPPSDCKLVINSPDSFIEFIDQYQVNVTNCFDDNLHLEYSLVLFPNKTIYQYDIETSRFYDQILIRPYQQSNNFNVRLPYFAEKEVVMVFLIQDSLKGIQNITTMLKIKELQNFNTSQEIEGLMISDNFDFQLINYNLMTERLKSVQGMQVYKEKIYRYLINLINNNSTYKNNQTESIYTSISNLLAKNESLFGLNETLNLEKLNATIQSTYVKISYLFQLQKQQILTSEDNLERSILLKLYVSFMNILSSFTNYRISLNQSSSDVQDLLNQIQDQLQSISVANEPLFQVFTNSINLNFGFLTQKLTNAVAGAQVNESTSETEAQLYQFSMTRYMNNPYQTDNDFPQNSTEYQAVVPTIKEQGTNSNVEMKSNVNFEFPIKQKLNITQQCISQSNTGKWSASVCKTKIVNNVVVCQCENLSPTSIMDQLSFIEDKLEQVFSLDTLLKFGSFPFYKTVIFYFYIFATLSYIAAVGWGMKVDNKMFSQVDVELEKAKNDNFSPQCQDELQRDEQVKEQENIRQSNSPRITQKNIFKNNISLNQILNNQLAQKLQVHNEALPPVSPVIYSNLDLNDIEPSQQTNDNQDQKKNQGENIKGLKNLLSNNHISYMKALLEYIKFFHQILQILYKSDKTKPRGLRATIVYTSILGSLAVIFVFNQVDNLSFNVTLMLITAPANKFYQILLEKVLSHKKKPVRIFGVGIMITCSGLISYTMLAGLVMMDSVADANKWSVIFIISFLSDNLIYSPIQLIIQYLIQMELLKLPIFKLVLEKLLDEVAKEFLYGLANTLQQLQQS